MKYDVIKMDTTIWEVIVKDGRNKTKDDDWDPGTIFVVNIGMNSRPSEQVILKAYCQEIGMDLANPDEKALETFFKSSINLSIVADGAPYYTLFPKEEEEKEDVEENKGS